ncbi:MAG: hypothetical protein ACOZAA_02885 [Pseudomonadota bacterium]
MKAFFDNDISPNIARAICQVVLPYGHLATPLRDKFDPKTADLDWIRALEAEGGWVVISADRRITRNKAERAAWRSTSLIGFFLASGWKKLPIIEQTARLLLWWDKLDAQSKLVRGGSVFEIPIRPSSKIRPLPL